MHHDEERAVSSLELPAILDLAAAQMLKEALGDALFSGSGLVLSGLRVERVGTPAVQVLLAAARSSEIERRRFALIDPSNALTSAFRELGLMQTLEQWGKS